MQKAVRTNDIENVGKTARHHTFFEMMGNFSIGDYFKEEAIPFAWEFLTSPEWIGFEKEKLYVTVYTDDDDAYRIWTEVCHVDPSHILRTDGNFWEIGEGPGGPDTELFYINENTKPGFADPFVLDNTARDGYYYMYGTLSNANYANKCYRSTNLMDWEDMGYTIDKTVSSEIGDVLNTYVMAPEVVYDSVSQLYYMFFSATPKTDSLSEKIGINATHIMMVATSKSPDKDFKLVDFSNLHNYSKNTYSEYYAKYSYFDPVKLREFYTKDGTDKYKNTSVPAGKYLPAIDPHPYEDETGKYLFWVDQYEEDRICAVQMIDWLTPNWDTFTVVTRAGYQTVDGTEKVTYDLKGAQNDYYINEAPEVIKHDGKYYLTYSTGAYANETYQVIQAVADSPLGTYRKLTEGEGAILLSSSKAGNTEVTGAGHHSFVTAGDKLYMVYHRHDDPNNPDGNRNPAIDDVKWITNSNGLPVMYVNGATRTLQPRLEAFSNYTNIADDATISADPDDVSNIACLTDGLLSISNDTNSSVIQKVGETTITNKTTFTFNFDSLRDVRGIMVYNSKKRENIFTNISQIELVCEENGVEVIRTIENVAFKSEYYTDDYVTLGAAAYAEFAYLKVKSVKITVDVPQGQEAVGISEIRILGK